MPSVNEALNNKTWNRKFDEKIVNLRGSSLTNSIKRFIK